MTDDTPISKEAVLFRMNTVRAALFRKAHENMAAIEIAPDWVTRLDCLSATVPTNDCGGLPAYYALDLPLPAMWLPDDVGILSVELCGAGGVDPVEFNRATPGAFVLTRRMRFGKPSMKNPYFYRVGNRLYLLGGERQLDKCKFTIFAVLEAPAIDCDPATERETDFPLPNHLLEPLIQMVADGFLKERQVPQDTANDGKDKGTNKPI